MTPMSLIIHSNSCLRFSRAGAGHARDFDAVEFAQARQNLADVGRGQAPQGAFGEMRPAE